MVDQKSSVIKKVKHLNSKLGPTLVATSIGFRDRKSLSDVSESLEIVLSGEQRIRLDELLEIWETVEAAEGEDIARAWFIGANPWLNGESAVSAIREDRFAAVKVAAQAMVEDTPNF
jgi:hypothetical protein